MNKFSYQGITIKDFYSNRLEKDPSFTIYRIIAEEKLKNDKTTRVIIKGKINTNKHEYLQDLLTKFKIEHTEFSLDGSISSEKVVRNNDGKYETIYNIVRNKSNELKEYELYQPAFWFNSITYTKDNHDIILMIGKEL